MAWDGNPQGVFFNLYLLAYLISPKHCHAFVGYLEEEAVHTYTAAIKAIDEGSLSYGSCVVAGLLW
jgi:Alternative oxidase